MSDEPSVADTLRLVRGFLSLARKAVADSGHLEAVRDVDTLINITEIEAAKQIARIAITQI